MATSWNGGWVGRVFSRAMGRRSGVAVSSLLVCLSSARGVETPADTEPTSQAQVSWDFGSGPGKTSNFYVGKRTIEVSYDTAACLSRFTLESASFEFAQVRKGGKLVPAGPPFLMLKFQKHLQGAFDLLPKVTITQNKADAKGKPTGQTEQVVFPFREKKMASQVPDWDAANVEVTVGAPGAIMGLHNPFDWSGIAVQCD